MSGVRTAGALDVAAGASLTLASVAIVGLPPVSTDFGLSTTASAIAVTIALLGTIGLVVCWFGGSLHSSRVLPGVAIFAVGIVLWVVTVFVAEPLLGWRVGAATVGLLSEMFVAGGWFVLRGYPAKAYPALLLLLGGAVALLVATTLPVLVAGLTLAPIATFVVALLVLRTNRPRRDQSSAAL